jgi:hypothetical protein
MSIDDDEPIRLLVKDQSVYEAEGGGLFSDARLAAFSEPLRALQNALPENLRSAPAKARTRTERSQEARLAVSDDDGFWSCVGHYAEAGAELGGEVGFVAGVSVGILGGGAPSVVTGPLTAVAGAAGGAAAGFLGGAAIC